MWIRSPATYARSGATAANATAPGRSRPPWKGRASPRPGSASAASCANRACGRAHAQTIQSARYSRAWFRLLVSNRGSFVLANEENVHRTRAMPFISKTETQSAQEFGRYRYRRITVDRHAGSHYMQYHVRRLNNIRILAHVSPI